ncbi:S-layer homology domain-containing protein [Candidatus Gracilibacteria bacterium]|nr:S-layer homology domain-containing protein [Candidatus Gracilibacteria bacterium]
MKKLLSAVVLGLMLSNSALAASEADFFPKDTGFYATVDFSELEGVLKDWFEAALENVPSENETLAKVLSENTFGMAIADLLMSDDLHFSLKMTAADFAMALKEEEDVVEKVYNGKKYYQSTDEWAGEEFMAYLDGYLVATMSEEDMKAAIDGEESLADNSDFRAAMAKLGDGALMKMFFADGALAGMDEEFKALWEEFGYLAVSIDQIANGFRVKSVTEFKSESKITEVRDLHRLLPNGKAILAANSLNLYDENSGIYSELFAELDDEFFGEFTDEEKLDFDFEEVMKGAKEFAVLAQNGDGIFPEVTFLAQMRGGEAELEKIEADLMNQIKALAGMALLDMEVDERALTGQDEALTVVNLKSIEPIEDLGVFELQVTMGMTDNGVYLVSTNPRIFSEYGEGNSLVATDDFYFSFGELESFLDTMGELSGEEEDLELVKELLSPLGEVTARRDLSAYPIVVETMDMDFDMEQAKRVYMEENFVALMESLWEEPEYDYVDSGSWYSESSDYLLLTGVTEDFEAGEQISRGEAVEWLIRGLRQTGEEAVADGAENPFKDVSFGSDEIATAKLLGFVTGYSDGTFKPNSEINRAEFAALLGRVARKYGLSGEAKAMNFPDVKAGAWYYEDVRLAYELGWMTGDDAGTFRPAGLLTEAEAAVVVKRILDEMWEMN